MKGWRAADQADGSLYFDAYDQLKSLACKMPRKLGKQHEARDGGVTGGHLSHQQIFIWGHIISWSRLLRLLRLLERMINKKILNT